MFFFIISMLESLERLDYVNFSTHTPKKGFGLTKKKVAHCKIIFLTFSIKIDLENQTVVVVHTFYLVGIISSILLSLFRLQLERLAFYCMLKLGFKKW